ncbi:MAG: hypothetical protein ABI759_19210 [Candidatus Solibacter sp.]
MVSRSAVESEIWKPETEEDREAIREQLGRLLASSVFSKSTGCSNLLSYIVNQALKGAAEHLKERTLGVEVFGRAADYDTATDHVVRSMAGEIRKRLAQYYMEHGRSGEIRIDVPPGSYLPRFVRPVVLPVAPPQGPVEINIVQAAAPEQRSSAVRAGIQRLRSRPFTTAVAVAAIAILLVLALAANTRLSSGRALNGFWQPVLQSPNPVLVCIGAGNQLARARPADSPAPVEDQTMQTSPVATIRTSDRVYLDDAIALTRFAGWLQQKSKSYRILLPSRVTFAELQGSPAVLIGFNNDWTTSLAGRLRFTMERGTDPDTRILRDRKNPGRNNWSVDLSTPSDQPITDYALVVRAMDPETGQIVITAAGLTHFGTLAASEFLTNPDQIAKLDTRAHPGWERRNLAIVLSTEVIKGSPGSAKIIATDFW